MNDKSDLALACMGPESPFITLVCFDHKLKQKAWILQVTDFESDRMIIDKVEAWHKEKHQEIFYTYKPINRHESRRQL